MKKMGFAATAAFGLGLVALSADSQVASAPARQGHGDKDDVTITGCVVKGDGGYVLTSVAEETVAAAAKAGMPSTPQPAGTVLPGRVIYWLSDDDDLAEHAGHRVSVKGEIKGDVEKGKVSAEREQGFVELEFKVDGDRKVTVKVPDVPAAIGTSGAVGDKEADFPYIVRRIDVDSVKMLSAACR
jgi:hypothetical protein